MTTVFLIAVRLPGTKKSALLGPGGNVTSRRIRAVTVQGEDNAQRLCDEIERDNPGVTAKPKRRR